MRRLLGLFVQYVVVGVPDQRPVVGVKEHLVGNLKEEEQSNLFQILNYQSVVYTHTTQFNVFSFISDNRHCLFTRVVKLHRGYVALGMLIFSLTQLNQLQLLNIFTQGANNNSVAVGAIRLIVITNLRQVTLKQLG